MLCICDKTFDISGIYNSVLIGDILYIIYYNSSVYNIVLRMLKFSMVHRCIIADDYIMQYYDFPSFSYIDNNKLYMFTSHSVYDYKVIPYNLDTLRICEDCEIEKVISRCGVIMRINVVINGDFYYVSSVKDKINCFTIINKKEEVLVDINRSDNNVDITVDCDNNTIYLPKRDSYTIRYHKGFLLIFFQMSLDLSCDYTYILYNLSKKTFTCHESEILFFTSNHHFVCYEKVSDDSIIYIYDPISNNKIFLSGYPHKGVCDIFQYKNSDYLIIVGDNRLKIYMMDELQPFYNIENMNVKHITIGTEQENVVLPLELLLERSALIRGLFSDVSNVPDLLLYDSYINMNIYKEFIIDGDVKNENLYKLYYICNYLNDININYVSELILSYVDENNVNIDESFKFLELLSTSLCDNQLHSLLCIIIKKYDRKNIYNMIMGYKNTKVYDFVYKQLFNIACDTLSKFD